MPPTPVVVYDVGSMTTLGNPSTATNSTAPPLAAFTNRVGVATDPTLVLLRVTRPDATVTTYAWGTGGPTGALALQRETVGRFYADVLLDQAGWWAFGMQASGAVTTALEGRFRVRTSSVQ